ncbi:MAG: non-canonical purine NTP pyrophosphatase, RdgB/HAM1 family [Thermoprotei archaeon]|nr:MAG: non-canonical purine NTP pyrophosphatase, RdgB/HAM1 family [Thermoprotei archaeon]RLF25050.1 MAG: non-canonical purine NTP pyrophosphatase, RdgB/HAM1 family [Thermoprotei archaeon]
MYLKDESDRIIVNLVTGNPHKVKEASISLREFNIEVRMLKVRKVEIQSDNLANIASFAALEAAKEVGMPVVVEDAGLFIEALNGFPGPYSSYVYKTIGVQGILKLLDGINQRNAYFLSVVAYATPQGRCFTFEGRVYGVISKEPRGSGGFGFDPIFIPNEGDGRTFAEMTTEEKCALSHRGKAFRKFGAWLVRRGVTR